MESGKSTSHPNEKILKKRQAAKILGLSIRTLERLVASEVMPVIRYSARCVRFRRSDIEAYIKCHLEGAQETEL